MTIATDKQWIEQLFEELVLVEGSTFSMGDDESPYEEEKPRYEVTISTFQMAKYPVTQALWQKVMDNNPSYFKGENRPVESISWNEICQPNGFLDRLNKIPIIAAKNVEKGKQFQLPTEAQWEYAARGGKVGVNDSFIYSGSNNLKEVGWFRQRTRIN